MNQIHLRPGRRTAIATRNVAIALKAAGNPSSFQQANERSITISITKVAINPPLKQTNKHQPLPFDGHSLSSMAHE